MQNRKGFTLIELLIVVVIIGILAAIAIPKFANTKEKAYLAAMKSDLRNLATAQEAYLSDYTTYATSAVNANFTPSTGVTISAIAASSGKGWTATTTHTATAKTCAIAVGTNDDGSAKTNPNNNAAGEGEPVCTK
ncbi:MAG TPA: prepilin-type N-terminal cleavage/methylation domain-containing protein [Gemmatimonadaceae bacterium]